MPDHVAAPVETVARRVADLRSRRGLTAKELGERLTALGVRWDRFTVANLESGKRQNVTVVEWLALARVLNVAPVHLLVPPEAEADDEYQVTPTETARVADVRAWVRGHYPLLGEKVAAFHAEVPDAEYGWMSLPPTSDPGEAIRGIDELMVRLADARARIQEDRGGDDGEHR
jgi:transcriptional regulator with XRE-family HTH domain